MLSIQATVSPGAGRRRAVTLFVLWVACVSCGSDFTPPDGMDAFGWVGMEERSEAGAVVTKLSATFLWTSLEDQCSTERVDDFCIVEPCAVFSGIFPPEAELVDAGPVAFIADRIPAGRELIPQDGRYDSIEEPQEWFAGDETARIHAPGGEAPPFDVTLATPGSFTLAAPPTQLPVDQALTLSWEGVGDGEMIIAIRGMLRCHYPAADGHATVSPAVLARVLEGAGSWIRAPLSAFTRSGALRSRDGWQVWIEIDRYGETTDGTSTESMAFEIVRE